MNCTVCGISEHFGRKLIRAPGGTLCSRCFLEHTLVRALRDNEQGYAVCRYISSNADADDWFYEYYKQMI